MTQFIYTHHQGSEGKMLSKVIPKPAAYDQWAEKGYPQLLHPSALEFHEYKAYVESPLIEYPSLGFSPSDNGKTFGEGEFEVKKQVITVKSGWIDTDDFTYDDVPESQRRIIAVPLSEKREERTQDELWEDVQKIMAHTKYPLDYARTSDGKSNLNIMVVDIPKVIEQLKSKFSITLK